MSRGPGAERSSASREFDGCSSPARKRRALLCASQQAMDVGHARRLAPLPHAFKGPLLSAITAGWRRVKLCDIVSDAKESQSCALRCASRPMPNCGCLKTEN
jgi:hypothetical protein